MKFDSLKFLQCSAIIVVTGLLMASYASAQVTQVNCDTQTMTCTGNLQLDWNIPTTREDGSPLPANQIAGYMVVAVQASAVNTIPTDEVEFANCNQCWPIPAGSNTAAIEATIQFTRADVVDDGKASLALAIATNDVQGQWSVWSDLVYIDVTFPSDFVAALTPPVKKTQIINATFTIE